MPRVTKQVESQVQPVFGLETGELIALRKLALGVEQHLTGHPQDDVDLGELLREVKSAQKKSKRRH